MLVIRPAIHCIQVSSHLYVCCITIAPCAILPSCLLCHLYHMHDLIERGWATEHPTLVNTVIGKLQNSTQLVYYRQITASLVFICDLPKTCSSLIPPLTVLISHDTHDSLFSLCTKVQTLVLSYVGREFYLRATQSLTRGRPLTHNTHMFSFLTIYIH